MNDKEILINKLKEFILSNRITNRSCLKYDYPEEYEMFKQLSKDEKDEVLPSSKKQSNYSFIKSIEDLKNFIKSEGITSRQKLKKFSGALNFFRKLSEEEKDKILPFRGIDRTKPLDSKSDFERFIKKNKILGRSDFKKRFNGLFKRFKTKLTEKEQDEILPKIFEDHTYLKTYEDFETYIKREHINTRWKFKKRVYTRFLKYLTKEEQEKLLPHQISDVTTSFVSIDDFQDFADKNMNSSDFRDEYSGIYKKFRKLSEGATEEEKKLFKSENKQKRHSFGEKYLILLLIRNNIKFVSEKMYPDLKDSFYLRYDFYLPDYNLLIEYHGEQHFQSMCDNCSEYLYHTPTTKLHDDMKYQYAKDNNINILFFTLCDAAYKRFGYFTEVITDPDILINKIKEIGMTNQS